jgi:hypothetical protein
MPGWGYLVRHGVYVSIRADDDKTILEGRAGGAGG